MKRMFLVFICIGACLAVHSQTKDEDILTFLKISNSGDMVIQVMEALIPQFKQLVPDVPDEFWTAFMKKIDVDSLLMDMVPVYSKYYTQEEIKQLIAFYKSPVGQKMLQVTPRMMQDNMLIGQKWGAKLGQEVADELIKSGYR